MRFEHRDGRERDAGIDMTPMMDIVFIMLIFFVLTASFTQTQTLDVERPSTASHDRSAPEALVEALVVSVDRSNIIWFDGRQVGKEEVTGLVRGAAAGRPVSVVVNADRLVPSGLLIEVIDQIRLGGVANVAVATNAGHS